MSLSGEGRKRQRVSRSDSPTGSSGSWNNEHGLWMLDEHLRSILCHRLGLPLVYAFHGKNPADLEYLRQESKYFPDKENAYNNVLQKALTTWDATETQLTASLAASINAHVKSLQAEPEACMGTFDQRKGFVDILLRSKDKSRPLMLLEVGLKGYEWWLKFDQCVGYLNKIQEATPPLLLGIMTVDKDRNQNVEVKLGVFLCLWKGEKENAKCNVRISFLWHTKTGNTGDASKAFGRLLRGVCDFSSWIERVDNEPNDSQYEYFGSNCCKVGDMVLRSYDNRFRKTPRSPVIYLSDDCKEIVGEGARTILIIPADDDLFGNDESDDFWEPSRNRSLHVIVTPYRPGQHEAKQPESFLPIIEQLEKLHKAGFVHGDIRGFNTVFGKDTREGYLIDFDFGGKVEDSAYPNGYNKDLGDGKRLGDGGGDILPWHDWWALGRLIFEVHQFEEPSEEYEGMRELRDLERKMNRALTSLPNVQSITATIGDLKEFLKKIQCAGWTVEASPRYDDDLKKLDARTSHKTSKPCAMGSPPKK